ncbi:MAG: HIT domain-containing protein [Planctomycetota bacterium]|nr:HIT domain-containing protein [Planctomycetota bacterium]
MNRENLWAPWRMAYLHELNRLADSLGGADEPAGSFLADYWRHPEKDEAHHVIHRAEHGMILLNRYPYANGHLLVALGEPRPALLDYDPPQRAAFWGLIESAMALMQRALNPQGINMGINQGEAAGAGVPGHLHAHLVPRWAADTNFITVVGRVRIVPDSLEAMAELYRQTLAEMDSEGS